MTVKKKLKILQIISLAVFFILISLEAQAQPADKIGDLFEKMDWRNIGPAVMGGRTVSIDVVEKEPWIIYAAVGPSGVWRSINNGITWEPIFYKEKTVSVGAVTVSQSHPNIIWVGTGEGTARNSVTIGDGVYKSLDAGKTWTNMGLEETRHINKIIINPGDPNIVYVAALGHLWGPNEERGVYKTIDGGKTWNKVLYINVNTGIADLAMDPSDSLTLYAAAWEYQRFPYYFYSGGPNSGLYKTIDGGETWQQLEKNLPQGILGRIGVAVSRSNPNIVYALIEHEDSGIWRSEDKGKSWFRTCDNETYKRVNFRPFYYSQIRIDPQDDKKIYVFSGGSYVSDDMGEKFRPISGGTHPDHHDLWIDPRNPLHLIDGNDGGIDITYDGGKNWNAIQHMALAEVYQIGFDMRRPYYVYCGLQDNGLWGGPSATYDTSGIINEDWYSVGGGDGFYAQVDPSDYNTVYGNSQVNNLYRYDLRIGLSTTIRPEASLDDPPFRYNWNSPVLISPHDPHTIYTGGNYLFKSTDRGNTWTKISPDLSTNDPEKLKDSGGPLTPDNTGAEIHCTIITIAESFVQPDIIWCGTDDGNVQVTKDGGNTWKNVVNNIKGLPPNTWCSRIEASHFDAGTAYAAFDGHRSDDYNPYVYTTTDFGETWTSITNNIPFGWIHVVREDLKNPNLLFVGTEFEIFASLDGGKSWFSLKNNLPTTAVRDIAVHPRDNDLIIGTHGTGIWILDDITPLQSMTDTVLAESFYLFEIRPEEKYYASTRRESFSKPAYAAQNPPYGIGITCYFKEKPKEKPKLFIKNPEGELLFEIRLRSIMGIQKNIWNFQQIPRTEDGQEVKVTGAGFVNPPIVDPGKYLVELEVGGNTIIKEAEVLPDPRYEISENERKAQREAQIRIMILSRKMGLSVTAVNGIDRGLEKLEEELNKTEQNRDELKISLKEFGKKFEPLKEEIIPKGFGYRGSMEMTLRGGSISQLILMQGMSIGGYPQAPAESDLKRIVDLEEIVRGMVERLNKIIKDDLPGLNAVIEKSGFKPLRVPDAIDLHD